MDNCASVIKNIDELLSIIVENFEDFAQVLEQIIAEIIKNPAFVNSFISYINAQISNSTIKKKGIFLLNIFLSLATSEQITENAIAWLNNTLKFCKNETQLQDDAYKVIKPLLELCSGIPELYKSVTSGILSKTIEQITKTHYNSPNTVNALKCLETCIRLYAGPCTAHRNNLEKYLITYIDCSVSTVSVRAAGKCLHALQQVGQAGAQGIIHKQSWNKQQHALCTTIHSVMDQLFESIPEMDYSVQENSKSLNLSELSPDSDSIKLDSNRIINLIIYLQEMLLGAFPTAKSVSPNTILNVISRGLHVTSSVIGMQILSSAMQLSCQLYFIHKHLLELLQALIISLGFNLVPFATVIGKLIVDNLKCTSPKNANNVSAFCELRLTTYQTLSVWVNTCKSASNIHIFADPLLSVIITDITPVKNELNLSIQTSIPKHLNKKARKKLQQEQIVQSTVAKTYSPIVKKSIESTNQFQAKICNEALNFLQCLLVHCGHSLKVTAHKQMQEFIVKTLLDIQRGDIVNPYVDTKCKIGLYTILSNLVTNHHWNFTPPLEYAIILLTKGQTDYNPCVSSVCATALSNLNSFIHPACATLQFPLDLDELRSELNPNSTNHVSLTCDNILIPNAEDNNDYNIQENQTVPVITLEDEYNSIQNDTETPISKEKEKNKISIISVEIIKEKETSTAANNNKENDGDDVEKQTQDVPNMNGNKTSRNKNTDENLSINSSSYSVEVEILSDDEVMECVTIHDESEIDKDKQTKDRQTKEIAPDVMECVTILDESEVDQKTKDKQPKETGAEKVIESENIIDLDDDLCSSFVDLVD